jgi:hypothetical protein
MIELVAVVCELVKRNAPMARDSGNMQVSVRSALYSVLRPFRRNCSGMGIIPYSSASFSAEHQVLKVYEDHLELDTSQPYIEAGS